MQGSEITRLKQQIESEYTAGQLALSGLVYGTSQHQFITQRMMNMERCRLELVQLVGNEEAMKIMIEAMDGQIEKRGK
jgi:hypothetical protein